MAGICWHHHKSSNCFEYPKKPLLKSSYLKKYLPNFPTQKNPRIKNFKPKTILQSFLSLEIWSSPPLPLGSRYTPSVLVPHGRIQAFLMGGGVQTLLDMLKQFYWCLPKFFPDGLYISSVQTVMAIVFHHYLAIDLFIINKNTSSLTK